MRRRVLWGRAGGSVRRFAQTYCAIGGSLRFDFTVALLVFGRGGRVWLTGRKPFIGGRFYNTTSVA